MWSCSPERHCRAYNINESDVMRTASGHPAEHGRAGCRPRNRRQLAPCNAFIQLGNFLRKRSVHFDHLEHVAASIFLEQRTRLWLKKPTRERLDFLGSATI